MAETTTTQATPKAPAAVTMGGTSSKVRLSPNGNIAVWVEGRISKSDHVANTKDNRPIFETIVHMPAIDPYSHPRQYCVSSIGGIGRPGDDVSVECEIVCQPWTPRAQGNNAGGNYNGNRHPNEPPPYGDVSYYQQGPASKGRKRYPHYLWVIR